jgi:hypothetical protein
MPENSNNRYKQEKEEPMNREELEKQVTLLEDIQEIEDLQKKYCFYFSTYFGTQEYTKILDLFSEDTESIELESVGVFFGKAGASVFFGAKKDKNGPPDFETHGALGVMYKIIVVGGVVDVDPDGKTAKGRWQTLLPEVMNIGGILRQQWLHGYYENEYVKENGKWLFKKLNWNVTFYTTFEDGWLKMPLLTTFWTHKSLNRADAPPNTFYPYPSGYHFPYHSKHPITGE